MYNLSEWHRGTPTVSPVGGVNVTPKIRQIQKIHVFEAFWALFPYKLYRILMVFEKMFFGFGRKKIEKLKIFKIQFDFYFC